MLEPGFGAEPRLDLERFIMFSLLSISGAAVFASVFAAAESLCFFLGDATGVADAITEFLLSFSLYPEKIFGEGMRWVFYTVIPSGFIAFVSLAAIKVLDWPLIPLLALVAAAYAAASYGIFRLGLRRYESGNQMSSRIWRLDRAGEWREHVRWRESHGKRPLGNIIDIGTLRLTRAYTALGTVRGQNRRHRE